MASSPASCVGARPWMRTVKMVPPQVLTVVPTEETACIFVPSMGNINLRREKVLMVGKIGGGR